MSAATPEYNCDVLSELAQNYERSKADCGETTPVITAPGASANGNKTPGIKSKVAAFFSGAKLKGATFKSVSSSSPSPRATTPEVNGLKVDALCGPSVALDQLDIEAELVPVLGAKSFQVHRRASVALIPSTALVGQLSNGVAPPSTKANAQPPQRQQGGLYGNHHSTANSPSNNPPLRRAKTEQAGLAQSVRCSLASTDTNNPSSSWSSNNAAGRPAAFLQSPCASSTGDEPAQVHDFITPALNSVLFSSQPPTTTLPPGRENGMRRRCHAHHGSDHDGVLASGSDTGELRRPPAPLVPSLARSPSVSTPPMLPSPRRQSSSMITSALSILLMANGSTGGGTWRARQRWQSTSQLIMPSMPSLNVDDDDSDDGSAEADWDRSTGDVDIATLLSSCLLYCSSSTNVLGNRTSFLVDSCERPLALPRTTQGVGSSRSAADAQGACGCLAQMELPRKSESLHNRTGVAGEGGLEGAR